MYDELIEAYVNELNYRFAGKRFYTETGSRYTRIVQADEVFDRRFVYCFAERATGKLLKSATWRQPQQDKDGPAYRFDLIDDFHGAVDKATVNGSCFYK